MAAIATVAAVASAVSGVIGAVSAYRQGQSQQSMAEYNARMAQMQANSETEAAAARAAEYKKESQRRLATMRASYLSSGVEIGAGTPLLALMESAQEAAKNEVRIKRQGEMASWGLLSEANLSRMRGESAYRGGLYSAGSSLLSGAARAYGSYNSYGGGSAGSGWNWTLEEQ